MATKSETVLLALMAAVEDALPAGALALRNAVLPEDIPDEGIAILRDGDPGEPEQLLSPHRYIYEHRADLDLVVEGEDRETAFDTLKAAVAAALSADRTLGGTCDWVEAEAPAPIDLAVEGGDQIKAATVAIVLHYETTDPLL